MALVRTLHRWLGGLIGLLLAALGLSGAILAYKALWISRPADLPPVHDSADDFAAAAQALVAETGGQGGTIVLGTADLPMHRLYLGGEQGAYADAAGRLIDRWDSVWARPELWLFDFHHHLLAGGAGETVAGITALIGLGFIITGVLLWWPTRRTSRFRALPRRLTRSAIVRHHRDLGIVVAPILTLSCITGALMTLKPMTDTLLAPLASKAAIEAALAPPTARTAMGRDGPDWRAIHRAARARFPEAELRIISLPRATGDPIALRLRQPAEWLPNGRTLLWFEPGTGSLIDARDALAMPAGLKVRNSLFPLHAGAIGGRLWQAGIALAGLALSVLGGLACWSFWFRGPRSARPVRHSVPA